MIILPWSDILLLLEGHVVHFAAYKTVYSKDIKFDKDAQVLATSKAPILFLKNGVVDDRETKLMNVRSTWKHVHNFFNAPLVSFKLWEDIGLIYAHLLN